MNQAVLPWSRRLPDLPLLDLVLQLRCSVEECIERLIAARREVPPRAVCDSFTSTGLAEDVEEARSTHTEAERLDLFLVKPQWVCIECC